jgi:hypothetical protein
MIDGGRLFVQHFIGGVVMASRRMGVGECSYSALIVHLSGRRIVLAQKGASQGCSAQSRFLLYRKRATPGLSGMSLLLRCASFKGEPPQPIIAASYRHDPGEEVKILFIYNARDHP